MNTANREALALARRRGYVVAPKNRAGRVLAREWWYQCEQWRLPYVRIEPRRTWGTLKLDMEPAGERLSPDGIERLGELVMLELEQQPKPARGFAGWGNVTMVNAALSRAEHLAERLLAEALADLREQEEAL